jgi:hypothetical protein
MLSKAKVVRARKAVESLYDGVCDIIEYRKVTKANKSTSFEEVTVLSKQPCRLSYKASTSMSLSIKSTQEEKDLSSSMEQMIKLFISPDVEIKVGSKIVITQNGKTVAYKGSGQPAIYKTHQEITLDLFEGWA